MKQYLYIAKNIKGESIKGKYSCNSYQDLNRYIRQRGFFLIDYKLKNNRKIFNRNIDIKNICLLLNMLYTLQNCGMSIISSFDIIQKQFNKKIYKYILTELKMDISNGMSLYESMKKHDNIFPPYMINMIMIGEKGGKLDIIFERLYEYYSRLYSNKKKLRSCLMYPLITFIISMIISAFFVIKILPNIFEMIISLGGEIPFVTQLFVKGYYVFCICILVVLIFIVIMKFTSINKNLHFIDILKFKVPIYNKVYSKNQEIFFVNSLYNLISSGVNIIDAFKTMINASDNQLIKKQYMEALNYLNKGFKLYESIKNIKILEPLVISMIYSGEISGNLESNLKRIQILLEKEYKIECNKLINLIEPMFIIAISTFIGFTLISVVLPIINITTSI